MSYNIHVGVGMDKKLDLQRIADVINKEQPDLVGLQEVDRGVKRTEGKDEIAELLTFVAEKAKHRPLANDPSVFHAPDVFPFLVGLGPFDDPPVEVLAIEQRTELLGASRAQEHQKRKGDAEQACGREPK